VLEEMESSKLKAIRNELNNIILKKTSKKVRQISRKKSKPSIVIPSLLPSDTLGGKAGKVSYAILVGEVTNLYKTQNSLTMLPIR
jgi:hypothetical protein